MQPNDGRVISNFVGQALRGEDITIYGGGSQTRSFCFVDDLIEGLEVLMRGPAGFTGPVNLGSPAEFRIRDLAEIIIKMAGSASKLATQALPQDDPKQRQPDINLANSSLDWAPKTNLEDGLSKTIEHFRQALAL